MENDIWRFMDGAGHAHMCRTEGCSFRGEVHPHTSNGANVEQADELCVDCGYVITLSKNHVHKPLNGYQHDAEKHWGVCGCGIIMEESAHVNADGDDKCDVCGRTMSDTDPLPTDKGGSKRYILWIILGAVAICVVSAGIAYFLLLKKKDGFLLKKKAEAKAEPAEEKTEVKESEKEDA